MKAWVWERSEGRRNCNWNCNWKRIQHFWKTIWCAFMRISGFLSRRQEVLCATIQCEYRFPLQITPSQSEILVWWIHCDLFYALWGMACFVWNNTFLFILNYQLNHWLAILFSFQFSLVFHHSDHELQDHEQCKIATFIPTYIHICTYTYMYMYGYINK